MPPIDTVNGNVAVYKPMDGVSRPDGRIGVVGPNPVAHSVITSPGLAGTVVIPENTPSFTAELKSA
jgi:hypothetical protein